MDFARLLREETRRAKAEAEAEARARARASESGGRKRRFTSGGSEDAWARAWASSPTTPSPTEAREFKVGGLASAWYVSECLTERGAEELLACVSKQAGWTRLARRELLNLGGVPHPDGLIPEELPPWMDELLDELFGPDPRSEQRPNQALINRYAPGAGIAPHKDGPLYHPCAAIVSVTGEALLRFYAPHPDRAGAAHEVGCVLLEPRSLLIFSGELYTSVLHGVVTTTTAMEPVPEDVGNRHLLRAAMPPTHANRSAERVSVTLRRTARVAVAERVDTLDLDGEMRRRHAWWRQAIDEGSSSDAPEAPR